MVMAEVKLNQRAFVHVNGKPVRYLPPGRYWVFRLFETVDVVYASTDLLLAGLFEEQRALVNPGDIQLVRVGELERGLVVRRGRPVLWLGPGEHAIWTVERRVTRDENGVLDIENLVSVEVVDVSGVEVEPLAPEVRSIVDENDYVEVTAPEGSVAVRYVDGALDAVLPAGRHAAWSVGRRVTFSVIDLREQVLQVPAQETLTRDRVSVRLNLSATYRVRDAARLARVARVPQDVLYLGVQLAARAAVGEQTLDGLLADRTLLTEGIRSRVAARADELGLELLSFGVRDVILPGDMKALLNRVIEAQTEAQASVILRREEVAATRSLANTAKVLESNPVLLRLKELEAYKELAGKVGQLNVVLGDRAPTLNLSSAEPSGETRDRENRGR